MAINCNSGNDSDNESVNSINQSNSSPPTTGSGGQGDSVETGVAGEIRTDDEKKTEKRKRPGSENLIDLSQRTKEEQRRIAIQGGKRSGEVRRAKKTMMELAKKILQADMTAEQVNEILGTAASLLQGETSAAAVLLAKQVQRAAGGDTKATEFLRDTAGWRPKDQVEVEGHVTAADMALVDKVSQRLDGVR